MMQQRTLQARSFVRNEKRGEHPPIWEDKFTYHLLTEPAKLVCFCNSVQT